MTQDCITDGDHSVTNIDEVLREVVAMGEDFTFTLCSESFSMLPTGEENRARSLLTRIDLYQMWHVSMFHKNMIGASLKQGKMKNNKSTMYNMACDDEDHAIDVFPIYM